MCVTKYLELTKASVSTLSKQAPTPYLPDDDKDYDESKEPQGQLQSIAAKVIMKILYGARMARYDLLHVCHVLACKSLNGQSVVIRDFTGSCVSFIKLTT